MTDNNWQKVKEILDAALDLEPAGRDEFLTNACSGNDALRKEVENLLDSYRPDFMEVPIVTDHVSEGGRMGAGTTIGHYTIIRKIGEGGMGEVYLAKDDRLDRKVAIKVLNERYEDHESNIQRFIREAKAASALNHPNILVIHEIGETTNSHYIVSEFVDGKTLREILGETNLGISRVLDIAIQISSALSAAHSAGIIHRDIKPENIVVRSDGYAKVLDFGLAKLISEPSPLLGIENAAGRKGQTSKGLILGTVSYMSPEQAKGEAIDERTDVFSLGVLIFEMLSGRTPFSAPSTSETLANLINKEPPDLSGLVSGIPDELNRIVGKTLKKEVSERYDSVVSLAADLNSLKDRIMSGSVLERTFEPESNKKTELLVKPTGDANLDTHESAYRAKPAYWRLILLFGTMLILLATLGLVWYRSQPASTEQPHIRSLAVLPLRSLESDENYLGLGIADAIIRKLSQNGEIAVRPTSAVSRYLKQDVSALEAAIQLRTDAILEGTIQRSDDRLRISVNLLRASDGLSIWADNFDMRSADIFTIQDSVARQISSRLQIQIKPDLQARTTQSTTTNAVAYEYYLKGVYSFDQRRLYSHPETLIDASIAFFHKAIEADPNYALAYAKLGYAYCWKAISFDPDTKWIKLAQEMIERADAIDPRLAETHIARYLLLSSAFSGWKVEDAIRELLVAQQLDPNTGHTELSASYFSIGLEELGEREMVKALDLDPVSDNVKRQVLLNYWNVNRYDDWLLARDKYFPDDNLWPWYLIGKERFDEVQKMLDQDPELQADPLILSNMAVLYALKGKARAAEAQIPRIVAGYRRRENGTYKNAAYNIACAYALIGKGEQAVKWLNEAALASLSSYPLFLRDPYLDRIRQTPEFIAFMVVMKERHERYEKEFQ